jgi:uncharacterized protein YdeI (YjbR/CyaY-like superfamily)
VGEERAEAPVLELATQADWERWLDANHGDADAVWLKFAKKGSGVETVNYAEALEVALCYGWIDGQSRRLDDRFYLQRFTPRRKRSPWSRINRDKALALIEAGRMRPAGLAEIERAKADGRWDAAYEPASTATVPEDLQRALDANPRAKEFFESLSSQNRYAIYYRLRDAKKPDTRARRIEKFVSMLAAGEKIHS